MMLTPEQKKLIIEYIKATRINYYDLDREDNSHKAELSPKPITDEFYKECNDFAMDYILIERDKYKLY
jgi:hypothetical protein